MAAASHLLFDAFRLDPDNACLWHGAEVVLLKPKTFTVLHYLLQHAGQLVTKEALLDACWPATAVGDAVLKVCVAELRKALGESAQAPRYITTVYRRGYRFIAPVTRVDPTEAAPPDISTPPADFSALPLPATASLPLPGSLVEREVVLEALHTALGQARNGARQLVFITGEAGIGKTAVVEALIAQGMHAGALWVARGQCVEQYGTGEPYLPVLEALGQLCRTSDGDRLRTILRQQAPTWLVQMPWLLTPEDRERLQYELQGATRERMLREFAEVVDTLTREIPLLLVLEDLHWSDYATLDLVALLARRRTPARLLVIGTYRPVEVIVQGHPLRTVTQELQRQGQAMELPLALLSPAAVAGYLATRYPGQQFPELLIAWLHQHTDGHPLFLVAVVHMLEEQGGLEKADGRQDLHEALTAIALGVPEGLRPMLEQQLARLAPAAQRILEVASVAGVEFTTAAVAAGSETGVDEVEEGCEGLLRQQMLRALGMSTWPDGTMAMRYAFTHALYQQVAYQRLGAGRRRRVHQHLGIHLETAYGAQAATVAAELAGHFVQGGDTRRAVQYLRAAAENALRRFAHREAVRCYEQALAALQHLPAQRETHEQTIDVSLELRNALVPLGEIGRIFTCLHTAETLAQTLDDQPRLGRIAAYMTRHFFLMGEQEQAIVCGERALTLGGEDTALQVATHLYLGYAYHALGNYRQAIEVLKKNTASLTGPRQYEHFDLAPLPVVSSGARLAQCFAEVGEFVEGQRYGEQALETAGTVAHPFSLNQACRRLGILYLRQGVFAQAIALLERGLALCRDADLPLEFPIIASSLGSAYVLSGRLVEAIPLLEQAVEQAVAMHRFDQQALRLVALGEGYLLTGRVPQAVLLAQEAMARAQAAKERGVEAYVLRLLAALAAHGATSVLTQAETTYRQAIVLAEGLGMRPLLAQCLLELGTLYSLHGSGELARTALTDAIALLRSMHMTFWLSQAQAALQRIRH